MHSCDVYMLIQNIDFAAESAAARKEQNDSYGRLKKNS